MKKIIILIIFILACFSGYYIFTKINKNSINLSNSTNNSTNNSTTQNYTSLKTSTNTNNIVSNTTNSTEQQPSEEVLSSFSTKLSNKDEERTNNIQITCSSLNNTIVEPNSIFSFCQIVGKSTTEKGYKKADIFINGKKEKGLGGGNCQVSTTLYNAVESVQGLTIIERHNHSNHVPYIADGKDAAVSYGSYDFKFKNETNNKIKIIATASPSEVSIQILKTS